MTKTQLSAYYSLGPHIPTDATKQHLKCFINCTSTLLIFSNTTHRFSRTIFFFLKKKKTFLTLKRMGQGSHSFTAGLREFDFLLACHSNLHLEAAEAFLRPFRAYAVPPAHSSIIIPIMHHEQCAPHTLSLYFSVSLCFSQTSWENRSSL